MKLLENAAGLFYRNCWVKTKVKSFQLDFWSFSVIHSLSLTHTEHGKWNKAKSNGSSCGLHPMSHSHRQSEIVYFDFINSCSWLWIVIKQSVKCLCRNFQTKNIYIVLRCLLLGKNLNINERRKHVNMNMTPLHTCENTDKWTENLTAKIELHECMNTIQCKSICIIKY